MREATDYKQAAIEQWTADPCGANVVDGEPGSRTYFERLVETRDELSPWLADALDYRGASGLDVLDVGCGQGIDLYRYANEGAHAVGVDLTPRHVELARAHLVAMDEAATVRQADAEALPFDPDSFDRISSNGVLHHTPDFAKALSEIHRVLRPAGEARIIVYNKRSLHYWLGQVVYNGVVRGGLLRERSMAGVLSGGVEYSRIGARPLVRVFTPGELRRQLYAAGFMDVTVSSRHFLPIDTPITYPLRRWSWFNRPEVLVRIGEVAGWYLVGVGSKPA
jgi:SAM-dependent methyltransferase